ncbi:MAG: endonuclease [Firmicutes bacterium]|nr:endonuclease [Bacillota bacterium]
MQNVTIDRDKYIGGSDIPIIMGISPFKSRFDLLLEKAGLKDNDFTGNEYTEYGNVMEEKIRNYVNENLGKKFHEGKHITGDIRCHTDGIDYSTVLEIKTTSQIYENLEDYKTYLVQLLFYMFYTNKSNGILAVYERPSDFDENFDSKRLQIFAITTDNYKELIDSINTAVDQFRIDLEKVKSNPLITEEELLPVDLTELSNKVVALENQLAAYKQIEKESKDLKAELKSLMEKHNVKKWITNNGTSITLVPDGTDKEVLKFNETKFKDEHEDIYNEYLETKLQKGKSGYVLITLP